MVKCGCGVSDPTTEQKALLGELSVAMRVLTQMPLGEIDCPSVATAVAVWKKGVGAACGEGGRGGGGGLASEVAPTA